MEKKTIIKKPMGEGSENMSLKPGGKMTSLSGWNKWKLKNVELFLKQKNGQVTKKESPQKIEENTNFAQGR